MRPPVRVLAGALALSLAADVAGAQGDAESARSVVQIRCPTEDGEMKATGFVWPEPGFIVTALHAVAGCENGFVFSESARRETDISGFEAVNLEADLALLRLEDDLGLTPVPIVEQDPDTRGDHFVWGYPLTAEQLIDLRLEFAGGLDRGITTLGRAFSSADLRKLFREQEYPNRDTRILRVTTTIQPGHSGAPIFDSDGRVVAIADGGLLGGWRGINWSIPAHVYLPGLPDSADPIPGAISRQAHLFSAYAVTEPASVRLGPPAEPMAEPAAQNTLAVAGQVSVSTVLDALPVADSEDDGWIVDDLAAILPQRASWDELLYDAYLDAGWDEPVFVPAAANVTYDPDLGLIEATSAGGAARQIDYVAESGSFDEALGRGNAAFFGRLADLGIAAVPEAMPEDIIDADLEFVEYYEFFEGPDGASVLVIAEVNGPYYFGRAVHLAQPPDLVSDTEYADYLMMELAANWLNGMDWLDDAILAHVDPDRIPSAWEPEPSVLTLVRQVPLADVAQDFVEDADFGWKRDLAYLRSQLEPGMYEELSFDVYEDRETGATIAVPGGAELVWDPELGAVVAEDAGGRVRLAIAIERARDFDAAIDQGMAAFVTQLAELVDWDGPGPLDCALEIDAEAQLADCWDSFEGTDPATGAYADIHLALSVRDADLLGTSVHIVGEEENLEGSEIIAYLMMLIGAEYLSDFAEI